MGRKGLTGLRSKVLEMTETGDTDIRAFDVGRLNTQNPEATFPSLNACRHRCVASPLLVWHKSGLVGANDMAVNSNHS